MLVVAVALGALTVGLSAPAVAQTSPRPRSTENGDAEEYGRSHWRPHWARFDAAGAVLIAVAETAAISVYVAEPVTEPLWTDTLPLDEEFRSAFRIGDQELRTTIIALSDALFLAMVSWPILVDSLLLAGAVRGDTDFALQSILIDLEVLAVAHMATWLTSRLSGRVRPEAIVCAPAGTCEDTGSGPVASFVGGHSLMAFASAGLTCTHHLENPWIAGSVEGAAITCGSSLALATTLGFLRLAVDRHWASDIAIGSVMGAAIGFGLPWLLHYGRPRPASTRLSRSEGRTFFAITPGFEGDPRGVTVVGTF